MFDTHGYAGQHTSETDDGGTNKIGIGGALYCTQNDPKYYVEVCNSATDVTGMIPMSSALPTNTYLGRDTTVLASFHTATNSN